ncbi:MAG: hypothetical protein HW407_2103, partial [Bacteroidetes bacterium]|nr:hypothetical protein [Bacteroidota bacterium]
MNVSGRLRISLFASTLPIFTLLPCTHVLAEIDKPTSIAGKISLELGSAKNTFVEGEIIWFDVTVRNLTREPVTILMPDQFYYLKVMVQNSKGEMLPRGFSDL